MKNNSRLPYLMMLLWMLNLPATQSQLVRAPLSIPYESFGYAYTNLGKLQKNVSMLGMHSYPGPVLWVFNPAPTNWVIETSSDLVKWRSDRVFFSPYTDRNPTLLEAGTPAATNGLGFFRARMTPDLRGAASEKWRLGGIKDYTFDYSKGCFCNPIRGTVTVRGGQLFAVTNAVRLRLSGAPDPSPPALSEFETIDKIFETLDSTVRFTFLGASLDPELGYPRQIVVGSPEADSGFTITVANLKVP
jgi:hypothetical protein